MVNIKKPPLSMSQIPLYSINPDRNQPWNSIPDLPIADQLYRTVEIFEAYS